MSLEIIKAEEMGFCFGVRRALRIMEGAARRRGRLASLGEVVHNRQVVDRLSQLGIRVVGSLDQVEGNAVAVTSHGAGPGIIEEARSRGLEVVNTTCPFVRKAQRVAHSLAEARFMVIIFGDRDHPEVRGILGWAGERGLATSDPSEAAAALRPPRRLGILSQTTQTPEGFSQFVQGILDLVLPRLSELRLHNTICDATTKRQAAARHLATQVEAMLVVGGRHSSNTRRLAEVCRGAGAETYHIESASELDPAWLRRRHRVGVTAGASTPDEVIAEVMGRLEEVSPRGP